MAIEIRHVPAARLDDFILPICTTFGLVPSVERIDRLRAVPELDVYLGAFDGDQIVGTAGSFTFDMTVPGGAAVTTAGLTVVAVLPTHRRRGILRDLMRAHLDGAHRRGQAVAALWASEGQIYGRFGYGMAQLSVEIDVAHERTAFAHGAPPAEGSARVRLVDEDEAGRSFPGIWDRVRLSRPGMLSRSSSWWRVRRIIDPEWLRAGRPPLHRALLELGGRPAAYALYRFTAPFAPRAHDVPLEVVEAMGDSPEATRAIWRYLFDHDIVTGFVASLLPLDHPLFFLMSEPRRLRARVGDAVWVRLVDVGAALSRRGLGAADPLVLEVEDAFCPWNQGRYRIAGGAVERTSAPADLSLDVQTLGAAYLGGFGLTQLAQAGRVVEHTPGALGRGDAILRGDRAPWCPEIF
jgi:predicted acetyltransferase